MKLLWMKSPNIVSRLIMAVTGDDCSHFCFLFETPQREGLLFEVNLLGSSPSFLSKSLKNHTIVHSIDKPLPIETEDYIWDLIVNQYSKADYSFKGAVYLGWRKLLNRWFGISIPVKNKYASVGKMFCTEAYFILNRIPGFKPVDVSNEMKTPHDLWEILK